MNIQPIIDRITAQTTIAQVIAAQAGGISAPVDTAANLVALLGGLVGDRMYPVSMPEGIERENIVYQLVSSVPGEVDGYRITHTDTFVLYLRADTYAKVKTLADSVLSALAGSADHIQTTDLLADYDSLKRSYRVNIELEYSSIAAPAQTLPLAMVYPLSQGSGANTSDNCINQRLERSYAVVIAAATQAEHESIQRELFTALLGWTQSTAYEMTEHGSSSPIEGGGGLMLWRHTFRDATWISN